MTNNLDLEEQEQLDQLKYFWKKNGNTITWVSILVLSLFVGWNFFKNYQYSQTLQARAMYDEVYKVIKSADSIKLDRVFTDMKHRFPSSIYTQQAGLLVAKQYYIINNIESSKSALIWVASQPSAYENGYQSIAKLRLSGILMESKKYNDALEKVTGNFLPHFNSLIADRKGDIFMLQGMRKDAIVEYKKSFKIFEEFTEYRHLLEFKLNALGVSDVVPNKLPVKK